MYNQQDYTCLILYEWHFISWSRLIKAMNGHRLQFHHLWDLTAYYSFIAYKILHPTSKRRIKDFIESIVEVILVKYPTELISKGRPFQNSRPQDMRMIGKHFPHQNFKPNGTPAYTNVFTAQSIWICKSFRLFDTTMQIAWNGYASGDQNPASKNIIASENYLRDPKIHQHLPQMYWFQACRRICLRSKLAYQMWIYQLMLIIHVVLVCYNQTNKFVREREREKERERERERERVRETRN